MPYLPPADLSRRAVVDLGSNSVRLVVFEGSQRNPSVIFNEKAVLRLGRGLQSTGRLHEAGVVQAITVMDRYHALARAMGVIDFEVLATAAVRDAENGRAFVATLEQRLPGVVIHILSGPQEANFSAAGVLCGIPAADGILADIGGGSLELVRLRDGVRGEAETLRLGVIRLAERAGGDVARARAIAEEDLSAVHWLAEGTGRALYAVGGAWRALAHIHMAQTAYPLAIVHHYTIGPDEVRDLTGVIAGASKRMLERMPGAPRRRLDDLPYAAVALRRVLRATGARRVVFSASGLREGWYMQRLPTAIQQQDPLLAAGRDLAARLGRDPALPDAIFAWTAPLFPHETADEGRVRQAACLMSDIGSHDHPDYRAEQTFLRVLRQPGIALDHPTRAFLATTLALRYDADLTAAFLASARALLDPISLHRAECLGIAFRLAYTLSGGTPDLLAATSLRRTEGELTLHLAAGTGVFASDSVARRLDRLAQAFGITTASLKAD